MEDDQTARMELRATAGLTVDVDDDATVRIGLDGADWFGPGRCSLPTDRGAVGEVTDNLGTADEMLVADGTLRCGVRAYRDRPLVVFTIAATEDVDGLATGAFDVPSVGWPVFTPSERHADGAPDGLRALALQHREFALPATPGADPAALAGAALSRNCAKLVGAISGRART